MKCRFWKFRIHNLPLRDCLILFFKTEFFQGVYNLYTKTFSYILTLFQITRGAKGTKLRMHSRGIWLHILVLYVLLPHRKSYWESRSLKLYSIIIFNCIYLKLLITLNQLKFPFGSFSSFYCIIKHIYLSHFVYIEMGDSIFTLYHWKQW